MASTVAMFPGQGSQRVGMGGDFLEAHPRLRERWFQRADEILGMGLTELCLQGPAEALQNTENTQPAIFVVSMAILDVLRAGGFEPRAAAGHSLGEYSALVAASVLSFEDALRLVRRRGELMAAVNERTPGAMAAIIGLPADRVDALCQSVQESDGGTVEPANYNEPNQTVISGEAPAVERAMAEAEAAGAARVIRLQVGAPFHCSLMDPLGEAFSAELDRYEFSDPAIPVVANVTGDYVRTADDVKDALRRQVAGSVRWTGTMQRFAADGYDTFVEVGPGRVLTGLCRKIVPDATVYGAGTVQQAELVLSAGP